MISIVIISKDEPALDMTLAAVAEQTEALGRPTEVVVVDASSGRLDDIRRRHPSVRWLDFEQPPGVRFSIPHQRNHGVRAARGEIVVFTDAGCRPRSRWLQTLLDPILAESESVVAGIGTDPESDRPPYVMPTRVVDGREYATECPTINLAFTRQAFDAVGGFDERFEYGSDVDFTWRLGEAGFLIRARPEAVVEHEWGDGKRRLKRSYMYGRGRARLYRKHPGRLRAGWRSDPLVWIYPAFILGLPLTLRFRLYPLLLAVPAWRNRESGARDALVDHLAFGMGVLSELDPRKAR
jgi:GT2 family glycosyltransferase